MKEYGRFAIAGAILAVGLIFALYPLPPQAGRYQLNINDKTSMFDTATGTLYMERGDVLLNTVRRGNEKSITSGKKLIWKRFIEEPE